MTTQNTLYPPLTETQLKTAFRILYDIVTAHPALYNGAPLPDEEICAIVGDMERVSGEIDRHFSLRGQPLYRQEPDGRVFPVRVHPLMNALLRSLMLLIDEVKEIERRYETQDAAPGNPPGQQAQGSRSAS